MQNMQTVITVHSGTGSERAVGTAFPLQLLYLSEIINWVPNPIQSTSLPRRFSLRFHTERLEIDNPERPVCDCAYLTSAY